MVSGQIIASSVFTPDSVSHILLPMGAALLPHALGVTAGHALQMRHYNPEAESTDEVEALRKLQQQRVELNEKIGEALKKEQQLHREMQTELEKQPALLREVGKGIKELERPIRDGLETVRSAISALNTSVANLHRQLESTEEAARSIRSAMEGCAAAAKKTATFLGDVEKYQRLVVARLEAELFGKKAA